MHIQWTASHVTNRSIRFTLHLNIKLMCATEIERMKIAIENKEKERKKEIEKNIYFYCCNSIDDMQYKCRRCFAV